MIPDRFPRGGVAALALAQLVAWGCFYYSFAILIAPMGAELGWSSTSMNGALSLGLAVSGSAAYLVGRSIDRHGGRRLMVGGAIAGALLLVLWSRITQLWQLYAIWAGIGAVSAMVLYESAFAVLARVLPGDYRRAITLITLLGGLASTVFIPLTQWLVDLLGWRHALLVLALIELPVCAGIPWWLLRGREQGSGDAAGTQAPQPRALDRAIRHPSFWLLALCFVSFAFAYTALLFNLLPLLRGRGFTTGEAVAVYALIGPAQLAGRLAMLMLERQFTVTVAGLSGTALPVLALLLLGPATPQSWLAFGFALAFGAGMGVKTIVQATAAPAFFGAEGYGALQGAIVMPVYVAQALAPVLAAMLWQFGGGLALERALLASTVLATLSFAAAAALAPRR